MEKVGRNDPCPCGSGKKFKKCCEAKAAKKFTAHKIEAVDLMDKVSHLTDLFKSRITEVPTIPEEKTPPPQEEGPSSSEKS